MKKIILLATTLCFLLVGIVGCDNGEPSLNGSSIGQYGTDIAAHYMAYVYDYLNIFYVTEQGTIDYENTMTRFAPHDIFAKWAELNNVGGAYIVNSLLDRDMEVIYHGDPADPVTTVGVQLGNYSVFRLTLSQEFAVYMDDDRGRLLMESLEKTFYYYLGFDEFDLIIETGLG